MNVYLIAAIWVAMAVLVNPIGDFPLNDDWAYGWSVKVLLETGQFELSDWTAVNLLPQVAWGALFSAPLGFSFTALRLSTLTLGLVGVLATYGILREVKASPSVSLVGALVVAVNPLYFALANSFMSDVPSFALATGAAYFFVRGLRRHRTGDLLIGVVIAVVSILNRQTGLVLLPAFAVAWVTMHGVTRRSVFLAGVPGVLGCAVYVAYAQWLEATGRAPHLYNFQTTLLLSSLSSGIAETAWTYARNGLVIATYVGLFLLPALAVTVSGTRWDVDGRPRTRRWPAVVGVAVVLGVALGAAKYQRMPSVGNVLDVAGVGPSVIAGQVASPDVALMLHRGWQVVTALGIIGAAVLLRSSAGVARHVFTRTRDERVAIAVFAITAIALYLVPLGAMRPGYWFDRYLLPVLPLAMLLVSMGPGAGSKPGSARGRAWLGAMLLVSSGLFTVVATHDYLSWNRARWKAVEAVLAQPGISPRDVDAGGGREVRGWYLGHRVAQCHDGRPDNAGGAERSWRDFSCLSSAGHERYVISLRARDGYRVAGEYVFNRWLPFRAQRFYMLQRDVAEAPVTPATDGRRLASTEER